MAKFQNQNLKKIEEGYGEYKGYWEYYLEN